MRLLRAAVCTRYFNVCLHDAIFFGLRNLFGRFRLQMGSPKVAKNRLKCDLGPQGDLPSTAWHQCRSKVTPTTSKMASKGGEMEPKYTQNSSKKHERCLWVDAEMQATPQIFGPCMHKVCKAKPMTNSNGHVMLFRIIVCSKAWMIFPKVLTRPGFPKNTRSTKLIARQL